MSLRSCRVGVSIALTLAAIGCKFPYPADVPGDGDVTNDGMAPSHRLGGMVHGLWIGGAITLHLAAGDVVEDVAASATEPFTFATQLPDGASYLVTVADDGPDHDCVLENGSGRVDGADVELAVTCTNLIPHGIAISVPTSFSFDPRVTRYPLAVSILQQQVTVVVTGPSLTTATVDGQAVTIGQPSPAVALGQGQTTVPIVVTKGSLSQRYELIFDRGGTPIVEALYGRASNAGLGDRYGGAVAAFGEYVAVGAYLEDSSSDLGTDDAITDAGAVYIYRRSGSSWMQTQLLKGSAVTTRRWFGYSVAMADKLLVVGAPFDNGRGQEAGAAYVFRLDPATGRWNEEQRLVASDPHAFDHFGIVSVSGDRIAVAAPAHDGGLASGTDYGLVYVFAKSGATWIEQARVRASNPQIRDSLGYPLALDGDTLAVGYRGGHILILRRSGATWSQENVPPEATGLSLALEGDVLAIGQPGDASGNGQPGDQSAPDSGAVRVFARTGSSWTQTGYLKAASPQSGARVGWSVGLRNNTIVTVVPPLGELQAFQRVGGSWIAAVPLLASGPPTDRVYFGAAIALTRNGAFVGTEGDDGAGAGALQLSGTAWFFR